MGFFDSIKKAIADSRKKATAPEAKETSGESEKGKKEKMSIFTDKIEVEIEYEKILRTLLRAFGVLGYEPEHNLEVTDELATRIISHFSKWDRIDEKTFAKVMQKTKSRIGLMQLLAKEICMDNSEEVYNEYFEVAFPGSIERVRNSVDLFLEKAYAGEAKNTFEPFRELADSISKGAIYRVGNIAADEFGKRILENDMRLCKKLMDEGNLPLVGFWDSDKDMVYVRIGLVGIAKRISNYALHGKEGAYSPLSSSDWRDYAKTRYGDGVEIGNEAHYIDDICYVWSTTELHSKHVCGTIAGIAMGNNEAVYDAMLYHDYVRYFKNGVYDDGTNYADVEKIEADISKAYYNRYDAEIDEIISEGARTLTNLVMDAMKKAQVPATGTNNASGDSKSNDNGIDEDIDEDIDIDDE